LTVLVPVGVGCWVPTRIAACWLSTTITCGEDSTLTLESLAKALSSAFTIPALSVIA